MATEGQVYELSEKDKDILRDFRSARKKNEKKFPLEVMKTYHGIKETEKLMNDLKSQGKSLEEAFYECSEVVDEYPATTKLSSINMSFKTVAKDKKTRAQENTKHLGAIRKKTKPRGEGKREDCQKKLLLSKTAVNC